MVIYKGMKTRKKGDRNERLVVERFKKFNIPCARVPLSGSGSTSGDIVFYNGIGSFDKHTIAKIYKGEVKVRDGGFNLVYKYLDDNDVLLLRQDRKDWLIVMELDKFLGDFLWTKKA